MEIIIQWNNDPLGRDNILFHQQLTVHFHIQGAGGKRKRYENNENSQESRETGDKYIKVVKDV